MPTGLVDHRAGDAAGEEDRDHQGHQHRDPGDDQGVVAAGAHLGHDLVEREHSDRLPLGVLGPLADDLVVRALDAPHADGPWGFQPFVAQAVHDRVHRRVHDGPAPLLDEEEPALADGQVGRAMRKRLIPGYLILGAILGIGGWLILIAIGWAMS